MLWAFVGGAGNAILLICLVVLLAMLAAVLISMASSNFLVVVEQTASGNEDVVWPDEPYVDWAYRGVVLIWLAAVWLAPFGMILRLASRELWHDEPLIVLALAAGVLWLFFPIGVLSSLSGATRWLFLSPRVLSALACRPGATLEFYAATLLVLAVMTASWAAALGLNSFLVPVAAVLSSAGWLVYARLVGRIAWKLLVRKSRGRRLPTVRKDEAPALGPILGQKPLPAMRMEDDEESAESIPDEDVVEPRERRYQGYGLADDPFEEKRRKDAEAPNLLRDVDRRLNRAEARFTKTGRKSSLSRGVYSFPMQERTIAVLVRLSIVATVTGFVLTLVVKALSASGLV